jgi:DNA-binding MarR family transcriptional regulator
VDERLLQWLLHYPLQRAEDIVIGLARWCSRPTVYRHLDHLEKQGWIESFRPAYSAGKRLYHLTPTGLRRYAALSCTSAEKLAQTWRADRAGLLRLLPRLPVLLPIQDQINGLIRHLASAMTHQGRRPILVRWTWQRDYAHVFSYREQQTYLRVDAACAFCIRGWQGESSQLEESWFACFMLYQPLTNARLMRLRLDRLLRWQECAERWEHYHAMPPVLILASSPRQQEWWQHCAEQVASDLRANPLVGAVACLTEEENRRVSAWISPWQRSWRRLVTHEHCHLHELFQPMSVQALPLALRPEAQTIEEEHTCMPAPRHAGMGEPGAPLATRGAERQVYYHLAARTRKFTNPKQSEREMLALLSLHLSSRLWQLLLLLFEHPLLSREELAALLGLHSASVRIFLARLSNRGCLEVLETRTGERWQLTERGLRLLAAAHHADLRNLAQISDAPASSSPSREIMQRGLLWLRQHSEHTAGLYGFFASLTLAGDDRHQLRWWETGALCERRYQRQERWHSFRPDALAEYQAGDACYRFWLEWDRGTMNVRDLKMKFASYAFYLASREWVKERTPLPFLLCVAPDVAQEQRLQRVARLLIARTSGLPIYTTTARLLSTAGPLASVWRQVVPPQSQSDEVTRISIFLSRTH